MSAREAILGRIRAGLGAGEDDAARRRIVSERLKTAPRGLIPERAQLPDHERIALFCQMAEKVSATVHHVATTQDVPQAIGEFLRAKNLPASVRMGDDPRLAAMPWDEQKSLEVKRGVAVATDEVGVSHAFSAIAETGTLVLHSGTDNPTTVNFLPEQHIVVLDARDIAGDLETVMAELREKFGKGAMPRTVNFITGPSRSGDIEQKLLLGAHGPRAVHILLVGA